MALNMLSPWLNAANYPWLLRSELYYRLLMTYHSNPDNFWGALIPGEANTEAKAYDEIQSPLLLDR